jgi:uncharacterized protein YbaP (TraB family)
MRLIARLLLPLALLLAPAVAAARPPVWIVRDADSTIVLFGSVHVLPPGLDWRPPELNAALASADDVWLEVPFDQDAQMAAQRAALAHGMLPEGEHLTDLLSDKGRRRLEKIAADYQLSMQVLDRFQPWFAELSVSAALYQKAGGDNADGVERQLFDSAPASARKMAFETPEQQIGFFADAPRKEQLASLEETLKEAAEAPDQFRELVHAWMKGDVRKLDREAVQPLRKASPALYATLVSRRNARWTQEILQRLHGSGRTVVVVGVGHLVGKDSVPNRLRALGVQVEGPR